MVIRIHIYLLLVLAYMYATQKIEIFVLTYFFIIMHEMAHISIATLLNVKIKEMELLPIGVNAKYEEKISTYKEFLISLAGPIASFLFYKILKANLLKKINLFIAITNLIPLKPYDGGRIFESIFKMILGNKMANKICIVLQKICINLLVIIVILSTLYFKNYYLSIACIYAICIFKEELKNEKFNALINCLQID